MLRFFMLCVFLVLNFISLSNNTIDDNMGVLLFLLSIGQVWIFEGILDSLCKSNKKKE